MRCLCLDEETLQFSDHYKLGNSKVKMLHCTAFYAGRQSDEVYTSCDVLRQSVGKCFSLKVTGVVLTHYVCQSGTGRRPAATSAP